MASKIIGIDDKDLAWDVSGVLANPKGQRRRQAAAEFDKKYGDGAWKDFTACIFYLNGDPNSWLAQWRKIKAEMGASSTHYYLQRLFAELKEIILKMEEKSANVTLREAYNAFEDIFSLSLKAEEILTLLIEGKKKINGDSVINCSHNHYQNGQCVTDSSVGECIQKLCPYYKVGEK